MSKLHKSICITMLVAQGAIIGLTENTIPYPFALAPGAKFGLANLIAIIAIFAMCKRDSFFLVCLRSILTTLSGGISLIFFYSTSDVLLGYFGTLLIRRLGPKRISIIGINAVGGFLRSVGQLLTTSLLAHSQAPMLYLPFLSLFGLLPGIAIGIAASHLLQHVQALRKFQLNYEQTMKRKWS